MTNQEALGLSVGHARYVAGYAITSMWATLLLFSGRFSSAEPTSIVTLSMLCGVVACALVLANRRVFPRLCGRTAFTALCAAGMAGGTLLCTLPALDGSFAANAVGVALSGLCAMPLLLSWFTEYSRLPARAVLVLAGCALVLSAMLCFALSACPRTVAAVMVGASPAVSFLLLPGKPKDGADRSAAAHALPGLARIVTQAVSWRTLLGIMIVFFVMGALGVVSPKVDLFRSELSPGYLLYPLAAGAVFVGSAFLVRKRIDASILYKVLLVALSALLFLLAFLNRADISFIFYTYIACDVLLWTVLVLASKATPVPPFAVFVVGWLAECAGNVLGHNVAAIMGGTTAFVAVVGLLVIVAMGFAFSEGLFVLDLDDAPSARDDDLIESVDAARPEGESESAPQHEGAHGGSDDAPATPPETGSADALEHDPIAAFVAAHGLSRREAEVFELWVTGHGLKYIQDTLFISESTTKTHMRNIYRKCDVHNRAEIVALYERESGL